MPDDEFMSCDLASFLVSINVANESPQLLGFATVLGVVPLSGAACFIESLRFMHKFYIRMLVG